MHSDPPMHPDPHCLYSGIISLRKFFEGYVIMKGNVLKKSNLWSKINVNVDVNICILRNQGYMELIT